MKAILPGEYVNADRHISRVLRVWFPIKHIVEGYSVGVGADDYSIYKTGSGRRPWVVYRRGFPVFRCRGNGKPFGSYTSAIKAAAAVDRFEIGEANVKDKHRVVSEFHRENAQRQTT